jgi:hypothetical protein
MCNSSSTRTRIGFAALLCLALLACAATAAAQLPMPTSTQFDINGFLQSATVNRPNDPHSGGTLTVNGQLITVPDETIVILPANALTWQELFSQAPAPYGVNAPGGPATGMAMNDTPAPITTYEVHVTGNRVLGGSGGADLYIAGLINIAQNGLNAGAGFINFMDYSNGEMEVGGVIGVQNTGTKIRFNDPPIPGLVCIDTAGNPSSVCGRYGRGMTPDLRFSVDPDNPTIASATGFPMCFPRIDPAVASDPDCPQTQRPKSPAGVFAATIQTNNPVTNAGVAPDATKQAPFEVGDYVTFAGTLVNASGNPTVAAGPGTSTYVSAHTVINNVAIFTWPGTNPAYVSTEVALIGTGGLTVAGAGEAAIRTRFEGMTTDPTRNVHLYGIDLSPIDGSTSDRDWGTIGVDPGPPNGAVKGRWRFRPPCTATLATDKACTPPPAGTFLPPTREVRAVVEGAWKPPVPGGPASPTTANGIIFGQYHAPIQEYIFPENIPGTPIVPNNFNALDFLAQGGYSSSRGTLVGQLNPWPDSTVPQPSCVAPVANTGGPYTVAAGGTIQLNGSATGTAPLQFAWKLNTLDGILSATDIANPNYTAICSPGPCVVGSHSISLIVTNACGASVPATGTIQITAGQQLLPSVNPIAPVSVFSGAPGSFTVTGTDPNNPPLTFTLNVAQAPAASNPAAPQLINFLVNQPVGSNTATVTFTAPTLPAGQTTPFVYNITATATSTAGTSAPTTTTVTVNPLADAVAITNVDYRIQKTRLTITATSSADPTAVLTLQPYLTQNGTIFNPATIGNVFTNLGAGAGYQIILVGAPPPACRLPNPGGTFATPCTQAPLTVKSNLGGTSPPHAIDRIRN